MKKFLAVLLLAGALAIAPAAQAQLAPFSVQHASKDCGIAASCALAFPNPLKAGNLIVIAVRVGSGSSGTAVRDSLGNVFSLARQQGQTVDKSRAFIFYAMNTRAGADSITVTRSTSVTLRLVIKEYTNILSTAPLDVAASAEGSSNAPSSGAATTTGPSELIVAVGISANPRTWKAAGTFLLSDVAAGKVALEDQVQSVPGPIAGNFTLDTADQWAALIAAFKPAPAGPPPDITPPAVSMTSPADATVISGIVQVSASASDNIGVTSVQFRIDGATFGAAFSAPPYIAALDTATLSAGAHTIDATATDAAGNSATSAPIHVTFAGQLFDFQLSYTDGSPFAPGGTVTIFEFIGGQTWQTDVVAPISAAGRVQFSCAARIGTVYAIQTADSGGTVLWNFGTQLQPGILPTTFSGASATITFLKANNAWAGISNLILNY